MQRSRTWGSSNVWRLRFSGRLILVQSLRRLRPRPAKHLPRISREPAQSMDVIRLRDRKIIGPERQWCGLATQSPPWPCPGGWASVWIFAKETP